jgi:hypothetical protein
MSQIINRVGIKLVVDRQQAQAAATAVIAEALSKETVGCSTARLLGKDPNGSAPEHVQKQLKSLYTSGDRETRRGYVLVESIRFVLNLEPNEKEETIYAKYGRMTGAIRQAVHHFAATWEEAARPKTWIDGLTREEQIEWDEIKQSYKTAMRSNQRKLLRAKEEYRAALTNISIEQSTELEILRQWLRGKKVTSAPILHGRNELALQEQLRGELSQLGIEYVFNSDTTQQGSD